MTLTRREMILGMLGTAVGPALAEAGGQVGGGLAFGSSWRIVMDDAVPLAQVRPMIEAVIVRVDRQMSPFRRHSDLSTFNAASGLDWQPMPRDICQVASEALRVAALTDGAFDPTVGPLVSRFGFGPIKGRSGHFSGVEVAERALRKVSPGLTVDLCGIAKGYALDQIVETLELADVANALVEVGGEVKALGHHPDGRPWKLAIVAPQVGAFQAQRIVAPERFALATSGHTVNGLSGPVATSHIIDPARDRPATTGLLSVSVLAPRAMEADALATGFCALGPEAGVDLARRLEVSALFIIETGSGSKEVTTGGFAKHVLI